MNYLALCKGEVRDIQNDVVKKKKEEMDQELKDKWASFRADIFAKIAFQSQYYRLKANTENFLFV